MFNNIIKKGIRILIVAVVFLQIGLTSVQAVDLSNIESGIYTLENDVYHEQEIGMTMSRDFLEESMEVQVTKKKIIYTIGFVPSEYMENYRIKVNEDEVPVEVVESEESVKVKVEVDKLDANIEALIFVGPMERDVEFSVIPKIDTLKLVQTIEDGNSNIRIIIGVTVAIIIIGIGVLLKKKKN